MPTSCRRADPLGLMTEGTFRNLDLGRIRDALRRTSSGRPKRYIPREWSLGFIYEGWAGPEKSAG